MANISLPVPGVVKHEYIDAPLAPQVSVITVCFYLIFGFRSVLLFKIFKKGDVSDIFLLHKQNRLCSKKHFSVLGIIHKTHGQCFGYF